MAAQEEIVDFDIIENQKENIQSLPGGRSARELARIFSPRGPEDKLYSPSPNETRTVNDAIRQEYETELAAIGESDDPLDVYDRYVKWTLDAYPSAQATPESGLLPLLEQAVKSFLSSPHYKNDPRYLRLWLHYIRFFSDSPRETFAFLSRHHVGEGLALFYEEFAAWLEGAGRWTQAEEVYRLGVDREARPVERLARKYSEFQQRYEHRTQDSGPSSPALPPVRKALGAKVDPFASAATPIPDPQAQRPAPAAGRAPKAKSGKQKMAIFSDGDAAPSQPAVSGQTKGWDSIGSRSERRKENEVEAKPWAGETLKAGKKPAPKEKMAIFRDERGWMDRKWRPQKEPLGLISGNGAARELPKDFEEKLVIKDAHSDVQHEAKESKARKLKLREVKGETQTVKMKFDSPTGSKIRRKSTAEPTMTIHTRAATDEIYSIFNQPLKAETEQAGENSDFDDDDYTSAGESTVTGHISAASSDFEDDDTTFHKSYDETVGDGFEDSTRAESVVDGEWTQFSAADVPDLAAHSTGVESPSYRHADDESEDADVNDYEEKQDRHRFIPEMPVDYNPPFGPYRDPAIVAQNRLPFMTPIVEQTEYSLASMTAARNHLYNAKTPSKPQMGDLLSTPLINATPHQGDNTISLPEDIALSPTAKKALSSVRLASPFERKERHGPIIKDAQCNPTDKALRNSILAALNPPLASYAGYHGHLQTEAHYASDIQKFMKAQSKRSRSGDEASFELPILELPGAERSYIIRRELGAGAYAPVYLAESIDSLPSGSEDESEDSNSGGSQLTNGNKRTQHNKTRYGFEAIKMEVGPPNAWEFYMIRTANERLNRRPELLRSVHSIIDVHELHVYKGENILVEDYRGQGTLLDLVNLVRNEQVAAGGHGEGGLDEALAMFFTVELFRTVEALHICGVLHGDIKADNCLVRLEDKPEPASLIDLEDENFTDPREVHYSPRGSFGWRNKGLALIDFGRAIDMHAFQPSVQFVADWEPSRHECNEIQEGRPWTHQIDLYGLAGTVHVMLFGKYIESAPVRQSDGVSPSTTRTYRIRESLKRYWERDVWNDVFDLLLNPGAERWVQMELEGNNNPAVTLFDENRPSAPIFPAVNSMRYVREKMEAWLVSNAEKRGLGLQLRKLEAIFNERKKRMERS
ncbi:hypothetical protein BBP40_009918 [Aspergillus hancockii]|nr:hypothetical protein BBP40_009918 [Aspergillus hancockii]